MKNHSYLNRKKIIFSILTFISFSLGAQEHLFTLKLWYNKPATRFEEALPLGNGRIGVMVYGDVNHETLNLNESTLWGGGPTNTNPTPDAPTFLPKVREELFKENWNGASAILRNIQGGNCQSFVPMGNLYINQDFASKTTSYYRELDLNRAISLTRFTVDSVEYTREIFVSAKQQVAVIHLTASKTGALNFSVNADTPFENAMIRSISNNEFVLLGQLPYQINSARNFPLVYVGPNGEKGMRYQYRVKALSADGTITTAPCLQISKATDVTLFISAATSFNGFDKRPDTQGKNEDSIASDYLNKAMNVPYEQMKQEHITDYQCYFNRVSLNIGNNKAAKLPTDERLIAYSKGNADPALEALYFQFGRYLLISSSRPGGVPANLQGVWNKNQRPSWGSNYTTNINLQMNYWPAETLGLSELTQPLMSFIGNLSVTGKDIARNFYNMNGWAVHHNSDIWAHANPVGHKKGDPKWANWSLGSPWLCQHLFEHYRFTQDKDFLRETAYPLMKGAADFCKDWLIEKDGYLITAPSTSPENVFIDDNGNKGVVTIASTMDMEIIWDLYNNLIQASEILNDDATIRAEWKSIRNRLYPLRIGKNGNLIEWYKDWQDAEPQHRHVSHLFGLHPGREISPLTTPELAKACEKTLQVRGDGGTGWSKAWKINFWSRLLNGDHAYKMYRELLSTSTLPNLFDTHPPFQIDGNFGSIAGIGEMLLQSQNDELHLLPALPSAWPLGEVKGLCARGGFVVDLQWKDMKLTEGTLLSKMGGTCTLRTSVPLKVAGASVKSRKDGIYYLTKLATKAGKQYKLLPKNN
ncbi:glycoside hydrolase family 95 protein [uncultured Bacteroides sp.]|uniref:glycoside hydrolase family 95 protein n=1 Tax=uncultured Bacteroides sp. TaxID=162156 RepID=UPI002AA93EAA|nr:glycoside hydrolase family 95 protein [uncultured Bacteroides sp.]